MSQVKYARRWGYDHDARNFLLLMDDACLAATAVLKLEAESGGAIVTTIQIGASAEIHTYFPAAENEWVQGTLHIDGQVVDTFGVRTDLVTCPHCHQRIDMAPNDG